jgi:hypothetical protein
MKWEITHKTEPELGETRFLTKFAWLPTVVISKITMTDHIIWFELYIEEQEYAKVYPALGQMEKMWVTVAKTIHI